MKTRAWFENKSCFKHNTGLVSIPCPDKESLVYGCHECGASWVFKLSFRPAKLEVDCWVCEHRGLHLQKQ